MKIHPEYNWRKLTNAPGIFTFGYYDRCPWNHSNEYHLALRIPQEEHLPKEGEKAEVGFIERKTAEFNRVAETEAWCHQQGAMTLWLKHRKNTFIYNDFISKNGKWKAIARIHDIEKGPLGEYENPVYTISPDGKWAAVLNFGRIPRRGYSYARAGLSPDYIPDLDNDGLFIMNMENGKTTLVASYRRIMAQHSMPYVMEGHYIWLNHAIFNSDSTKVMVLIRHAENPGTFPWSTDLMTMNIDGSGLRCPLPSPFWSGQISHQIWGHRPEDILVDANWRNKGHEYVIFDETRDSFHARKISNGMGPMGHLIYSPDGKWIAADTYPDPETRTQQLAIVNTENGNFEIVGNFAHTKKPDPTDIRCDLHPRWSADGALLTVDSIHDGARNIYILETEKICN